MGRRVLVVLLGAVEGRSAAGGMSEGCGPKGLLLSGSREGTRRQHTGAFAREGRRATQGSLSVLRPEGVSFEPVRRSILLPGPLPFLVRFWSVLTSSDCFQSLPPKASRALMGGHEQGSHFLKP